MIIKKFTYFGKSSSINFSVLLLTHFCSSTFMGLETI